MTPGRTREARPHDLTQSPDDVLRGYQPSVVADATFE